MERKVAEELMQALLSMGEPLNAATEATRNIGSQEEQESVRRTIGRVMDTVYVDLMRPIIRQYPDLDPDR
jgi:hypothetical protein